MSLIEGPLVPHAVPTLYRGIRFRSRLEAKWAAFFDRCDWQWLYEPIDLAGYIPDFVLQFSAGPLLVEVKPALYFDDLDRHVGKIEASGWTHDALIVGTTLFQDVELQAKAIGWLGDAMPDGGLAWGPGHGFRCGCCGRLSILNTDQSWRCRVSGCYDGDAYIGDAAYNVFTAHWASACNATQWRGQR